MIIRLYSFNKKVNSTARPSGSYKELNCNIKDRSSVIIGVNRWRRKGTIPIPMPRITPMTVETAMETIRCCMVVQMRA